MPRLNFSEGGDIQVVLLGWRLEKERNVRSKTPTLYSSPAVLGKKPRVPSWFIPSEPEWLNPVALERVFWDTTI